MTSHSAAERQTLADALAAAGPDAPTLCQGWTARDLAAHLVSREGRPDSGPGIVIRPLAGWTERIRRGYAKRPFEELVDRIRSGPPRTSMFALPGVDASVNLTEHFVHCEDVLRAGDHWEPRLLPAARQEALWRMLVGRGRMFFRRSPVGVAVARPGGEPRTLVDRQPAVVLRGEPGELVLYAFGRGDRALVDVQGDADAVARFRSTRLGV